jgi:hypothetical protein
VVGDYVLSKARAEAPKLWYLSKVTRYLSLTRPYERIDRGSSNGKPLLMQDEDFDSVLMQPREPSHIVRPQLRMLRTYEVLACSFSCPSHTTDREPDRHQGLPPHDETTSKMAMDPAMQYLAVGTLTCQRVLRPP